MNKIVGILILLLVLSPFNAGWQEQINRPKIRLCYCEEGRNWITGHVEIVEWIHPYCDGNKCWGINYKTREEICMYKKGGCSL